MNLKEKFEVLAKSTGWNERLSNEFVLDFSSDSENFSKLLDHIMLVLEKKEITCVELNRSFERQQLELEASKEQASLSSIRLKEMREKLTASGNHEIELNSRISSLTAQILTINQNLKREKSQSNWSAEELQKTLDAFSNFRREQSVLICESRAQAEAANFQAQEIKQKLFITSQSLTDREKQIYDFQEQVGSLKAELYANEANFTREMNSNTRMVELYRTASEEASERISILQNEIEELRELLTSYEAQDLGHTADLETELEDRENIIKTKNEQLEKMRIALDGLLKVAKVSQNESEPLIITSDNMNEFTENKLEINAPLKQIYAEYVICTGKLAKSEEECYQIRLSMQEMLNEINSRAPLFDSIKSENSRLQGDITALTDQLIEAVAARDIAIGNRFKFERNLTNLLSENETLQQESNDLSQQVQRLIFEIENNSSAQLQDATSKRHCPSNGVLRASEIITENFVDITSISQLQQRNQELLRSLRGISAKFEALEKEKESPYLKAQLESALKELNEMHEARKRQTQMVETILKTKTSSSLAEHGTSLITKAVVSETLNMELEHIKKQLADRQEILKRTISELEDVKKQLTAERVYNARLSAQKEIHEVRLKMTQETLQQERLEAVNVRERVTSQIDSFNLVQSSTHKLMADLNTAQDRESRLHGQVEKLQNEVNVLMMDSARLQQETLSASAERDRFIGMLNSMQGVLSEHEASESTLKRHFTSQLEFMQRELEASRSRLSDTLASHAASLSAVERDRMELFKRLENLSEELTQRKEANLRLEGTLTQAQEKINDLERVLNQAASESTHDEQNVKNFELRIRALSTELKNQQISLQNANLHIIELEKQGKEFEDLKLQLNIEKEALSAKNKDLQDSLAEIEHLKDIKIRLEEELITFREKHQNSQNRTLQLLNELEELRGQFSSKSEELSISENEKNDLILQLNRIKAQYVVLDSELGIGKSEQNHLKLTIKDLESRLKNLQEQNEAFLDEAQNVASSNTINSEELDGGADLGVIRFLREEKDKLRVDRDHLLSEVRNFQFQAEEAHRILNSERLAVSSQSADYARLLAEVEKLNSVRANGALQQQEFSQLKMKISMLETQLRSKSAALAPMKDSLDKLQIENDELKEFQSALQTDRDTWKIRFETAISTASDTSPIESELKQVKLQSEMFRQRAIALTKNLAETRTAAQREIKELQIEIEKLKIEIESVNAGNTNNLIGSNSDDIEMSHFDHAESDLPASIPISTSFTSSSCFPTIIPDSINANLNTPTNASISVLETPSFQELDTVKESVEVKDENQQNDEDINEDSIYKESENSPVLSELISETISVFDSPVEQSAESFTETITDVINPELISSSSVIDQMPTPLLEQIQSQPIIGEVPRKKIVSLSRIVGNSSNSTSNITPIISSTPTMITTASGKKFVPVTFPDPPSASSGTILANASINSNLLGTSPSGSGKTKKMKKGLGKKKNKSINNNMSD